MNKRLYCVSLHEFSDIKVYAAMDAEDNSIRWYSENQLTDLKTKGYDIISFDNYREYLDNPRNNNLSMLRYLYPITPDFVNNGCFSYNNFSNYCKSYVNSLDSYKIMCKTFPNPERILETMPYFLSFKMNTSQDEEICMEFLCNDKNPDYFALAAYDTYEYLTDIHYDKNDKNMLLNICNDLKKWFDALVNGYDYESSIIFETLPPTGAILSPGEI